MLLGTHHVQLNVTAVTDHLDSPTVTHTVVRLVWLGTVMMVTGMVLLLASLAAVCATSIALALKLGIKGSSERLLAALVLGHLLILTPVYALSALSALTRASAVVGVIAACLAVMPLIHRGRGMSGLARGLGARERGTRRLRTKEFGVALRDLREDLYRLIAPSRRGSRLSAVLVIGISLLIAWQAVTCYYAPSFRAYDAPWYHEPIIAFTVQERGLNVPPLPDRLLYVASLARGSELVSAWLVLVTGSRALIELPSVLGFAMLWLSAYRLGRIMSATRQRALGWASVVVLTPGLLAYTQSTYVDLHVAALLTSGTCFALAHPSTVARTLLALVAAGLAVAMKLYAIGPGAALSAIVLLRAWHNRRNLPVGRRQALGGFAALVAAAGIALATPIRNAVVFGNPLYPVVLKLPLIGPLPGSIVPGERDLFMSPHLADLLALIFQRSAAYVAPFPHTIEVNEPMEAAPTFNYGYAMPTIGLALAAWACVVLAGRCLRSLHAGFSAGPRWRTRASCAKVGLAVGLLLSVASFFLLFPITRLARYLGFVLASTGAIAASALSRGRQRALGDALLVAALFLQVALVAGQSPLLLYTPREIVQLAALPPASRELALPFGAFATVEAAQIHDTTLVAGSLVLFGDDVWEPAPLWNSTMSNRVVYLPGADDPTVGADRLGARLLACTRGSPRCTIVAQRSDAWELVGPLYPSIITGECLLFLRRHER